MSSCSYPTTALPGRDHLLPIEICIPFLNLRYAPPPSLQVFQKCAARPRPPARPLLASLAKAAILAPITTLHALPAPV